VAASNVTTVAVTCVTNTYQVAVDVSGMGGTGLVVQDNSGDNLAITGDGRSTFAATVPSGQPYDVTVLPQPTSPWQTYTVTGGNGTVGGADVTVAVACVVNTYTVRASVTGLTGPGLVLQNNSTNILTTATDGTFPFSTPLASGATYSVSVLTQPSDPRERCVVASPTGTVTSANVTVSVSCGPLVWVVNTALDGVQVVVPTAGGGVFATVPVGTSPSSLAITPDGQKVYVSNRGSNDVSVISAASQTVTATIAVDASPASIAVTPDGSRVYVSTGGSKTVSVIDATTDTMISSISLAPGTGGLAVKPDGTELWVSAGYGPDFLNVVSIPDHTVLHSAGAGSAFIGDVMRFLPNGSVLYAASVSLPRRGLPALSPHRS
jgi:YVTN family beta-propeller protein